MSDFDDDGFEDFDLDVGEDAEPSIMDRIRNLDPRFVVPLLAVVGMVVALVGIMVIFLLGGGGPGGGGVNVVDVTFAPDTATTTPTATLAATITLTATATETPPPTVPVDGEGIGGGDPGDGFGGGGEGTILPGSGEAILSDAIGLVAVMLPGEEDFVQVFFTQTIPSGSIILTSERSSAKLTLPDGSIVRIGSQTQLRLGNLTGTRINLALDFGKAWHVVGHIFTAQDLELYEVEMPTGLAYATGYAYFSTEWNSTNEVGLVTCLFTIELCALGNPLGQVLFESLEQSQASETQILLVPVAMSNFELDDWTRNVPEVEWLTPTATGTATGTGTQTITPTRTPDLPGTNTARTQRAQATINAATAAMQETNVFRTATAQFLGTSGAQTATLSSGQITGTVAFQNTQNSANATATQRVLLTGEAGTATQGATQTQIAQTAIADGQVSFDFILNSISVAEGDAGTTNINATVQLFNPPLVDVGTFRVSYATSNGSATAGEDYQAAAGTLDFTFPYSTRNITLTIIGDVIPEGNENFFVTLSSPTHIPGGGSPALPVGLRGLNNPLTVVILDNDALVSMSQASYTVDEGVGSFNVQVQVSIAGHSGVTVDFAAQAVVPPCAAPVCEDAIQGTDFSLPFSPLVIPAGQQTANIVVTVIDDSVMQYAQRFNLVLTGASGAAVNGALDRSLIEITDNDFARANLRAQIGPVIQPFSATTMVESDSSVIALTGLLTNALLLGQSGTVDYTISFGNGAMITAPFGSCNLASPNDDVRITSAAPMNTLTGQFSFIAGSSTSVETLTLELCDDVADEPDNEQIIITISNPQGDVNLGMSTSFTINITDNDLPPVVDFNTQSYTFVESISNAQVRVDLTAASGRTITVSCRPEDGSAIAGQDYVGGDVEITFNPGTTTAFCFIPLIDDNIYEEPQESFNVTLVNVTNATIGTNNTPAQVILLDDDPPPRVSFSSTAYQGLENQGLVTIQLALDRPSSRQVAVRYSTRTGGACADVCNAVAGVDYVTITNFTRTITPLSVTEPFTVQILDNAIVDGDRTFEIVIHEAYMIDTSDPLTVLQSYVPVTIIDND